MIIYIKTGGNVMKKFLSFIILLSVCSVLLFTTGCNPDDLFMPYYDNEKLQIIYAQDAIVYTFENKATFITTHDGDDSQNELYISPTAVDNLMANGTKILSDSFDEFAYNNNYAYVRKGDVYYVVDVANEEKAEYSSKEFVKRYSDYENLNWYNT